MPYKLSELPKPLNQWHDYLGRYFASDADARQWRRWQEERAREYARRVERWRQRQLAKAERAESAA